MSDLLTYRQWEKQGYNEVAGHYESLMQSVTGVFMPTLIGLLELKPDTRLLDVASGPGLIAFAVVQYLKGKIQVVGVDFSENMVGLAKQRAKKSGVDNPLFEVMDAEALTFPQAMYDRVSCGFGLMHFADSKRALTEMHRVLKPGGRLVVSVWGVAEQVLLMKVLLDSVAPFTSGVSPTPQGPSIFGFGKLEALNMALVEAGFQQVKVYSVTQKLRFKSMEHYWDTMVKGTARLGSVVRGLSPEVQESVYKKTEESIAPYRSGSEIILPAQVNLGVAVKK